MVRRRVAGLLKSLDVVAETVIYRLRRWTDQSGRWLPVAVSACLLLVGSAIPLPSRHNPDFGAFGPDKLLHALGHLGFAATLVGVLDGEEAGPRVRTAALVVVVSTGYGVCTELLQESVPGRQFERGDVVAGLIGSVAGVALARRQGAGETNPITGRQ